MLQFPTQPSLPLISSPELLGSFSVSTTLTPISELLLVSPEPKNCPLYLPSSGLKIAWLPCDTMLLDGGGGGNLIPLFSSARKKQM